MKKTRIIASLLCIMMIVCALPVMQASAAVGDLDDSIAAAMGVNSAINVYEQVITEGFSSTDVSSNSTEDTYTENGVMFDTVGSTTGWMLAPTQDFYTAANAVVVKVKMGGTSGDDQLNLYTEAGTRTNPGSGTASATTIRLTQNVIYIQSTQSSDGAKNWFVAQLDDATFRTGTDWLELMVVHGTATYEVYVKNSGTNDVWRKLEFTNCAMTYQQSHAGKDANDHFYASAKVASADSPIYLKSVSVYQEDTAIRTIEAALTAKLGSLTNDNKATVTMTASSHAWDFANSTMTTYTRGSYNSISTPSGADFTNEGLDLSKTNGTDAWRYSAFSGWCPGYYEKTNANGYYRAIYARVKGNVTISTYMQGTAVDKLRSVPGKKLSESNALALDGTTAAYQFRDGFTSDLNVDNNWVEYLIVPRNGNAEWVWAKSATQTGGVWVQAIDIERYCWRNDTNGTTSAAIQDTGVSFSGSGVVAEWKIIDFNNNIRTTVADDTTVTPATATTLWFEEEFDVKPSYSNTSYGDAVVFNNDGVLYAPAKYADAEAGTAATNGGLNFYNTGIPVGGYAEIRMKSNGTKSFNIDDGTYKFQGTLNCDYSGLTIGDGTSAKDAWVTVDSDMSWRTWRFVRTESGYDIYSKADDDTGWRIHTTGVNVASSSTQPRITLTLAANADGVSAGNGMVDYIKIYGPAPTGMLTLTDGYGTATVADGGTLAYPNSLRAIVGEETGKLLVVTYKGNDMLKAQIVNVEDMANKSAILDARGTDADTVKVFLWDSFSGLNRKTPVVTLNL